MSADRFRRGALWFAVVAQVVGGVLGFALGADGVFVGIEADPLARLTLRLAVYGNAGAALVGAAILLRSRDLVLLRALAAGHAVYHGFAGMDGLRTALGHTGVALHDPIYGPAGFHGVCFVLMVLAALAPR